VGRKEEGGGGGGDFFSETVNKSFFLVSKWDKQVEVFVTVSPQ